MAKGKRARRNAPKPKPKPPKRPPLAVFDDGGAAGRATIAACGEHIVMCAGTSLRFHTVDAPIRIIQHGARIVAVARSTRRSAALDRLGTLMLYDDVADEVATRPVGDAPRALIATPDRFIAVIERGFVIVDEAGAIIERVDYPRSLVAAADPDGTIVVAGEDNRLAEWTGKELVEIPPSIEQIVAIAPLGGRRFACVGTKHWFLLDLAQRELDAIKHDSESARVATSPNGERIAWIDGGSVLVGALDGANVTRHQSVYYGGKYSEPANATMTTEGIAFLDADRLAIALDSGRGNIIDIAKLTALKLDPQPGDPRSRWIFIYNGNILIAE